MLAVVALAVRAGTVICLPPDRGLSVSLAMEDLAEVSSLSRRTMLQPVFVRLQNDICLLRIPLPAEPSVFLAVDLAVAGDSSGLPCSADITTRGVGPACTPVVFVSVCAVTKAGAADHVPFWFKPVSNFGLSCITMPAAVHFC